MQRFKKHRINLGRVVTQYGYADDIAVSRYVAVSAMSDARCKFVYGANGTLCRYARWRSAFFSHLCAAASYRYMRQTEGSFAHAIEAQCALARAREYRNVVNLVFARMEG